MSYTLVETKQMPWQQFARYPGHPRQRNTEMHLKKAKKWLGSITDAHLTVAICEFEGVWYKCDGHTRVLLWETDTEVTPENLLTVNCFMAETYQDLMDLYDTFDNQAAAENSIDKVWGAFREFGFEPKSSYLRIARLQTACEMALRSVEGAPAVTGAHEVVQYWLPEWKLIDTADPTRVWFNAGVSVAALLSLRRWGHNALGFWGPYCAEGGDKDTGKRLIDPSEALRQFIRQAKGESRRRVTQDMTAGIAMSCFERWRINEKYFLTHRGAVANLRPWNLENYVPRRLSQTPRLSGTQLVKKAS